MSAQTERIQSFVGSLVARSRTVVLRTMILCAGWWILNEGELAGAAVGAFVVAASLAIGLALPSVGAPRWQLRGLVRFTIVFMVGSLRGGLDVARRAFAPGLPVSPAMLRYPVRLSGRPSRHLFSGAVSLMPGTLSVSLDERELDVHVLVDEPGVHHVLERVEDSIARAVGERLEAPHA